MVIKKYLLLLFLIISSISFAQKKIELTPLAKISILTFGPGDDLYSKFGHTAIRIQEPSKSIDIVFDYGNFASFEDGFYWKFIQGQLDYTMGGRRYKRLIESYKAENRSIYEQELNLSFDEKKELFSFLQTNFLPENRVYSYEFFFDNCATKIPQILTKVFGDDIKYHPDYLENKYTFRELIHQKVTKNSWSGFGIDIALGADIDKKASTYQHMFLPSYVHEQLTHSTFHKKDLVKNNVVIYEAKQDTNSIFLLSPIFWLSILLVIVILITYRDYKKNIQSKWLDFFLFFTTGAAGLLLFFLWFLTDHVSTVNNFNILWAFPLNSIMAFVIIKKTVPTWTPKYLWTLLILLIAVIVLWLFKIQIFSPVLVLILIALAIRYVFLLKRKALNS